MKRIVKPLFKLALWASAAILLPAQIAFTSLYSFHGTDGEQPNTRLFHTTNGYLYGTALNGGADGCGSVFRITPSGNQENTQYSLCSHGGYLDGRNPMGALLQAANGEMYGTTYGGVSNQGPYGLSGTIFKVSLAGELTTVYDFCSEPNCPDGYNPQAGLVQASNGDLYGTTGYGGSGANCIGTNCGTIFKITPSGTLTTLYSFCAQVLCADGNSPNAGLIQARNGDLYGTTEYGGGDLIDSFHGVGTAFRITPSGTLTTLYVFCTKGGCSDGAYPTGDLVQATDGNLYGTTAGGGSGGGTVFRLTPSGTLTTLYTFCAQLSCPDGKVPSGGLVQATDGNLYGATLDGGANGGGTVFKITLGGKLTTLYSFCAEAGCSDGTNPNSGLTQDTNGDLFGTTANGGASGQGTVYRVSVRLQPFVKMQTTSGKVGAAIKILGTGLTGTTSVSFNGTDAEYKVDSSSEITATVPVGATTGQIQVITPEHTLKSHVPFIVRP